MKKFLLLSLVLFTYSSFAMEIIEYIDEATGDISALIKKPVHHGSNLPFSYYDYSSINGVCKTLGYEKAASGSGRHGKEQETITVNSDGIVTAATYKHTMKQLVCLNFKNKFVNEKSTILDYPKHKDSGLAISYYDYSSINGVCKLFGFDKAAKNSGRHGDQKDTLSIDSDGNVKAGPYTHELKRVVCISPR